MSISMGGGRNLERCRGMGGYNSLGEGVWRGLKAGGGGGRIMGVRGGRSI